MEEELKELLSIEGTGDGLFFLPEQEAFKNLKAGDSILRYCKKRGHIPREAVLVRVTRIIHKQRPGYAVRYRGGKVARVAS